MPNLRCELHHRICNLRYGTHDYRMNSYYKSLRKESKLMQTKGQLMKSLNTAFSFAPPSILSLTICKVHQFIVVLRTYVCYTISSATIHGRRLVLTPEDCDL